MTQVIFEDAAPNVAATIIILAVISVIVFPLRVYTRIKHHAWGADDWSMAISVIPMGALTVFCLGASFLGVGVHKDKLNAAQTETAMMWFFFFEIFFCLAIIPVKLSISLMLMRIAGPKKKYVYALGAMAACFVLMNAISFFYIIFRCTPVRYAWEMDLPGGSCLPSTGLADIYYADTAVNIITDWFCALLPIPLLWNLQLNTNAKLSVSFLLSLGVLASLSACIRLKYTVNLNNSDDYLHSVADVMIWGYAENGVGFIVGCISTLRPLFRKMFQLGGVGGVGGGGGGGEGGYDAGPGRQLVDDVRRDPYAATQVLVGTYGSPPAPTTGPDGLGRQVDEKVSDESMTGREECMVRDLMGLDRRGFQVHRSVMQTCS